MTTDADRRPVLPGGEGGLGLALVHQLADLVHVRSDASGTTVQAYLNIG